MTEHKHYYQAMFLLDNEEVRQGFNAARDWVRGTLEKHGLKVHVLRLWGERPLAYRIAGRRRATYLLGWLEGSGDAVNEARRELYLLGPAFRCLFLEQEAIPEDELSQGIPEMADSELVIPEELDFEELDEEMRGEPLAPEEESSEDEEGGEKADSEEAAEGGEQAAEGGDNAEAPAEEQKEAASTGGTTDGN
jgi:ribosomal protein S6